MILNMEKFSRLVDAAFTHKADVRNIVFLRWQGAIIAHHFYISFLLRLPNLNTNLSFSIYSEFHFQK